MHKGVKYHFESSEEDEIDIVKNKIGEKNISPNESRQCKQGNKGLQNPNKNSMVSSQRSQMSSYFSLLREYEKNKDVYLSNLNDKKNSTTKFLEDIYFKYSNHVEDYFSHNKNGMKLYGNKRYERVPIDNFLKEIKSYRKNILEKLREKPDIYNLKHSSPNMSNIFDEKLMLTPLPSKPRKLLTTSKEKSEFLNAERHAVMMRLVEYTHSLRNKEEEDKYQELIDEEREQLVYFMKRAVDTIQDWWKKIIPKARKRRMELEMREMEAQREKRGNIARNTAKGGELVKGFMMRQRKKKFLTQLHKLLEKCKKKMEGNCVSCIVRPLRSDYSCSKLTKSKSQFTIPADDATYRKMRTISQFCIEIPRDDAVSLSFRRKGIVTPYIITKVYRFIPYVSHTVPTKVMIKPQLHPQNYTKHVKASFMNKLRVFKSFISKAIAHLQKKKHLEQLLLIIQRHMELPLSQALHNIRLSVMNKAIEEANSTMRGKYSIAQQCLLSRLFTILRFQLGMKGFNRLKTFRNVSKNCQVVTDRITNFISRRFLSKMMQKCERSDKIGRTVNLTYLKQMLKLYFRKWKLNTIFLVQFIRAVEKAYAKATFHKFISFALKKIFNDSKVQYSTSKICFKSKHKVTKLYYAQHSSGIYLNKFAPLYSISLGLKYFTKQINNHKKLFISCLRSKRLNSRLMTLIQHKLQQKKKATLRTAKCFSLLEKVFSKCNQRIQSCFFYKLLLMYLYSHSLRIDLSPIISLINTGISTSYQRTLDKILYFNFIGYTPEEGVTSFLSYVKALLENDQSRVFTLNYDELFKSENRPCEILDNNETSDKYSCIKCKCTEINGGRLCNCECHESTSIFSKPIDLEREKESLRNVYLKYQLIEKPEEEEDPIQSLDEAIFNKEVIQNRNSRIKITARDISQKKCQKKLSTISESNNEQTKIINRESISQSDTVLFDREENEKSSLNASANTLQRSVQSSAFRDAINLLRFRNTEENNSSRKIVMRETSDCEKLIWRK